MTHTALRSLLFLLLLLGGPGVLASDLGAAKQAGLAGERADGYVGLVDESAPADVRALVADVNARRRAEYQRIARQNGIELREVEVLAARKAIELTPRGGWVFLEDSWVRK